MYICIMKRAILILTFILCMTIIPWLLLMTKTSLLISGIFSFLIFLAIAIKINSNNRSTGKV
jgi:uncharacterized membrane protein